MHTGQAGEQVFSVVKCVSVVSVRLCQADRRQLRRQLLQKALRSFMREGGREGQGGKQHTGRADNSLPVQVTECHVKQSVEL